MGFISSSLEHKSLEVEKVSVGRARLTNVVQFNNKTILPEIFSEVINDDILL